MKLGFEEATQTFTSASQNARVWTERWVADWVFCINCGNPQLSQLPPNSPVADFVCPRCADQFEVKSTTKAFGKRVVDGAYATKIERLNSSTNPNLLLLNYDAAQRTVRNLCVVPKHFFTAEIIEKRKELGPNARRAGWVGSNILLDRVPEAGRNFIVREGRPEPKDEVLGRWKATLFLQETHGDARGWLIEVMRAVEAIGRPLFQLDEVYRSEENLSRLYPNNHNIRAKIRQQLQVLRDTGFIQFVGKGEYRLTTHPE